jgi:diguanylate cyclase (GGDEF)-like protein
VPGAADHEFLRTLASQASVALNTAHLYERLDVERRKQARSFHQLEILFDVTRKLAEVSDLARMLSLVLRRAIGAVSAEKGSLMLVDEHTDELVVRVVEGLDDPDMQQQINDGSVACRRFRRGEGVAGRVWETRKPVRVNDSNSDHRFVGSTGSYVRALICMPLIVDDEVLGVLNITNPIDTDFDESDESILGALADQAAIAIARARLYEAAITDGLTGLRIRRFGMARLHEECKRARRYGTTLSVALCDIDFFKKVNDTYGHPAGDEVLRVVATTLAASIRQDIDIGARYGGEEFLIVMPETDLTGASHMAERLRGEVEAITTVHDEHPIRVTLSIGLAEFVAGETPKALVARADRALYQAKEGGRNTVVLGRAQAPPDLAADAGDLPPVHTDGGSAAVPPIITAKKLGRARADDRKEPQP